ncbi:helix-turn-helix domain-containing protein [Desulfovibrio sp. OttesenSCG-928-M14]|nr:helix-turn-helix domain-containing protein [Desulfovibrio sp. OttesenSCG-928-M14]
MVDERVKWPTIGMTLDEAAEALRVDPKTLRTLIKAGDFPARKVGIGYRIDPDAVKAWLALPRPGQEATEDE